MNEQLYAQALELEKYDAATLMAKGLLAYQSRDNRDDMKTLSAAWGRNARCYARAVDYCGDMFEYNAYADYSVDEYLTIFAIGSVSRHDAATLLQDWLDHTLAYHEVRARVDSLKQRKPKEKKVKTCPHCGETL